MVLTSVGSSSEWGLLCIMGCRGRWEATCWSLPSSFSLEVKSWVIASSPSAVQANGEVACLEDILLQNKETTRIFKRTVNDKSPPPSEYKPIAKIEMLSPGVEIMIANGFDDDGQGSLACCSPWGHKESHMTEWLNLSELWKTIWRFLNKTKINYDMTHLFHSWVFIQKNENIKWKDMCIPMFIILLLK